MAGILWQRGKTMKNGYFKLQFTDHESYVSLFPPVDGGNPIQVDELRDYLVSKGFPSVDVVALTA